MSKNQAFFLPFNEEVDIVGRATIISFARTLTNLRIPLHPADLIYSDPSYRNSKALASFMHQEQHSVKGHRIALWIITRRFASEDHAMKLAEWYQLSSITGPDTKLITVFLDSEEIDGWISKLAQEASINTYFISSSNLKVSKSGQFANLCDTLHRILWVQEPPNYSCHHAILSAPIHIVSL